MIRRGDIYYAELPPAIGSEQTGIRPVLVVQNDVGNRFSPTIIVVAITSQIKRITMPSHVVLDADDGILPRTSMVLTEQIITMDKLRLRSYIGSLTPPDLKRVDKALKMSLGL